MYAAKVIGTVVCTQKDSRMEGLKMMVVQPINLLTLENEGKPSVANDAVGAGINEVVMIVGGSSARQTDVTTNKPTDACIMAIIDYIDIGDKRVFDKQAGGDNK